MFDDSAKLLCMPALVPQLPEHRDTFPIIQDPPLFLLSSTALKIRLSTILAKGMGAAYYNNTFLQEEAAAACQWHISPAHNSRVMLLSAPERAAQMLFCPILLCLTLPALTKPGSEGQTDTRKAEQ